MKRWHAFAACGIGAALAATEIAAFHAATIASVAVFVATLALSLFVGTKLDASIRAGRLTAAYADEQCKIDRAQYLPAALREVDDLLPWTEPVAPKAKEPTAEQRLILANQHPIEPAPAWPSNCGRRYCGTMVAHMNGGQRFLWFCSSACRTHRTVERLKERATS